LEIYDYNFTAKVEQDENCRRKCQLDRDDAGIHDKFHPTVKDVEANAEREWRKNFRERSKTGKQGC
jgi:DNA topoisomerase-1